MKSITLILISLLISHAGISQTNETNKLKTLPTSEVAILAKQCTGLEITFYEGSSTVSMSGVDNTKFLAAGLDSIPPAKLNSKNTAYIMVIVNDEFYMDAELSYGENKYIIFKRDGTTYYNKLNEQGIHFFKQVLGE